MYVYNCKKTKWLGLLSLILIVSLLTNYSDAQDNWTDTLATQTPFKPIVTIEKIDGALQIIEDKEVVSKLQDEFTNDVERKYYNLLKQRAKEIGLSRDGLKRLILEHLKGFVSEDYNEQDWIDLRRPGQLGDKKREVYADLDNQYGPGNWRIVWKLGDRYISQQEAIQMYEDSYYEYLQKNPDVVEYLVENARDVYDNALSNVESGFDYNIQETEATHLQDIAVRRVIVLRLGRKFEGDKLIQIRSKSEDRIGRILSPGRGEIFFHRPELIEQPALKSWWTEGTVEDFYQSNRMIQVKRNVIEEQTMQEEAAISIPIQEELWSPQDYHDSQAISKVEVSPEKELILYAELDGSSEIHPSGETFIDLDDVESLKGEDKDFRNTKITAMVYIPEEFIENMDPESPNGIQLFLKDSTWKSQYSTWHNLKKPGWMEVEFIPLENETPPLGWSDEGVDISKVKLFGVKIGAGGKSDYKGKFVLKVKDIRVTRLPLAEQEIDMSPLKAIEELCVKLEIKQRETHMYRFTYIVANEVSEEAVRLCAELVGKLENERVKYESSEDGDGTFSIHIRTDKDGYHPNMAEDIDNSSRAYDRANKVRSEIYTYLYEMLASAEMEELAMSLVGKSELSMEDTYYIETLISKGDERIVRLLEDLLDGISPTIEYEEEVSEADYGGWPAHMRIGNPNAHRTRTVYRKKDNPDYVRVSQIISGIKRRLKRASKDEDKSRYKEIVDREKDWGQTFIDTALMRAYEAKKLNQNIIVALETSMIPEEQMPYIQELLNRLTRLSKEKNLDNILIKRKKGPNIASVVKNLADKTGTPDANIIFLGDYNVLEKRAFDSFRDSLNPEEWSFFAGVEFPENFPDNNYIRLLEMLDKAMNLWAGKDKPQDTQFLQIVQEGKRLYKFIIPEIEPMDYDLLKAIYKGQLKALVAA